jgi:hypothetical protein
MLSYTAIAVTVPDADAYAQSRAWIDWTGDEPAKTAALRRGQDYIAGLYNSRWNVEFDDETAPDLVKYAIIEAARRELVKPGSLNPDFVAANAVKRKKVKAGPAETETEFAGAGTVEGARPVIGAIDGLLAGLLLDASATTSVSMLMRA